MRNKFFYTAIMFLIAAACMNSGAQAASDEKTPAIPVSDSFSKSTIQRVFGELTPAVCVVNYTQEVTNPNSGETSKRDNSAIGLIVSADGLVMAPGHMDLENATPFNIKVVIGQGDAEQHLDATLLKKPDDVNISLLKVKAEKPLPFIRFTRGRLELGDPLMLIGVLSETLDFARSVVTCRIGATLEKPRMTYCLDTPVRFGFVGGPAVNSQGRVIGVVGFDLSTQEGGELYVRSGHPLVYQAELFQKYIDTPPGEHETVSASGNDAWLGVFTQPLDDDFAEYWNLPKSGGVIVSSAVPGAPAEAAGLQPGDVITSFNDVPIHAKLDREVLGFTKLIRDAGAGKTVTLKWLRGGKPMEGQVLLVARPKSSRDAGQYKDEVFGLTVREITQDLRIMSNLPEDVRGVIVWAVKSGSVAEIAGMRRGLIIMSLGDYQVTSIDDFKVAIDKLSEARPKEIPAFCRAGSATGFFRLEPRWNAIPLLRPETAPLKSDVSPLKP